MRMGIRIRLWLAFAAISGMTVIASAVAWVANDHSSAGMSRMVEGDVPRLVALSSLGQSAGALIAVAPSILFAKDQDSLMQAWRRTVGARDALTHALGRARGQVQDPAAVADADAMAGDIGQRLEGLRADMQRSLALTERHRAQAEQVDVLQQEYRVLVGLMPPDVGTNLDVLTQTNRIMVILGEVWRADLAALGGLEARLDSAFERLPGPDDAGVSPEVGVFLTRLYSIAREEGNVFDLKRRELLARASAAENLAALQALARRLDARVSALTAVAQSDIQRNHGEVADILAQSRLMLAASSAIALVVALLIAWRYVGDSVARRLRTLSASMRAIAAGDLMTPIPTAGHDEISDMGRALLVFRDALAHVRHLATHDVLTGLANRRLLEERLGAELAKPGHSGALLYINLRGFKEINDTFGHTLGDRVLLILADRLRWAARGQDLPARLGGDDFVLLVPGIADMAPLETYLQGLERVVSSPVAVESLEIEVQPVVGIARYPVDGRSAQDILQNADMAMNRAKTVEGTQTCYYSPEMGRDSQRRKAIRADLRHGIETGQLELYYQPKVNMRTGAIAGAEALVRWNHPQRGMISPVDFIPVAERSGLILPLGTYVLREGCRQARAWRDQGLGDLRVAVNMSPVQVLRQDVVAAVAQALEESDLPPHLLEIEITEGVLMRQEEKALQRLKGLRDLGVHLAIDDFGTGYSSLSYLKRLPVNCLKIDQAFVRHLTTDAEDVRLTRIMISMAHDFGLEVVAEGVETLEHALFLQHEGCDLGQGYYFAKPLPSDQFTALVAGEPPWRRDCCLLGSG